MNEIFYLKVEQDGQTLSFETTMIQSMYVQKFVVQVEGTEVIFEIDEENIMRALLKNPGDEKSLGRKGRELISVIAGALEKKYKQ